MNFVQATTRVIRRVTLGDVARELDVTTVDLSRARLDRSERYHRPAPDGWQAAVAKLARAQAAHLRRLVEQLDPDEGATRAKASHVAKRSRGKRTTKKRR